MADSSKVVVYPGAENPTHDIKLSDGTNTIGLIISDSNGNRKPKQIQRVPIPRTALKTTSGNQKYSDFEPPWSPISQDDWVGGRGMEDFDLDISRYLDSWRANTLFSNKIFLGGQETYTKGNRSQDFSLPGSVTWKQLHSTNKYLAVKFTASASYDSEYIYMWVRKRGIPVDDLVVKLRSDAAGEISTVLQTAAAVDTDDITDTLSQFYRFDITTESLVSGTAYWIEISSASGDGENHWAVAVKADSGTTKYSSDETTWSSAGFDLYYRITDADSGNSYKLFQYRMCMYLIVNKGTGAPDLYANGDRGAADANTGALGTLVDATKTWTVDEWAGCIVQIIRGVGSTEEQPWRLITGNDATSLTVDNDWVITHDTTTEYVIVGSDKFSLVGSHGLTADVTDVCAVNHHIYLCQGDDVAMRRMLFWNTAGTGAYQFAADGTNKAYKMCTVRESTDGLCIWRAQNKDATGEISISKEDTVPAWGTDITFAAVIPMKDGLGKITNIIEYGESAKYLWIFREGSIFVESGGKIDQIPLKEMNSAASYTNGLAAIPHNVYLYFNFGQGLERYYSSLLDDVGVNRDSGLPTSRQGIVAKLAGYPGKVYQAIDAGSSGYSSVFANGTGGSDGSGWCEVYRAPVAGQRIRELMFQAIPGETLDRLWVCVGDDIIWIPFPSGEIDPTNDVNMKFCHESAIQLGYMYAGMYDVWKFYHELKMFALNLVEDEQTIEVDYMIDDDTTWTPFPDVYDESPIQDIRLVESYGVNGKRISFRLRIQTTDNTKTPIIKGIVCENVSRVPVKYSYSFAFRVIDHDVHVDGDQGHLASEDIQEILDEWATQLTPLVMNSRYKMFDGKTVFIDPAQGTPIKEMKEGYIESLQVIEV